VRWCLQLPSNTFASSLVVGMGVLWAVMGGALLLATEYLENEHSKCALGPLPCFTWVHFTG
jgi:hypothetical protein